MQMPFSVVGNNARYSFVRFENLPREGSRIFAVLVHQLESFIRMQKPDIYGFGPKMSRELGTDERQQILPSRA